MRLQKRCAVLVLTVLLLCSMSVTVFAKEVPDLSRTGYITVTMTYEKEAVPGGTLTLYKVGDAKEDDGNYSFVLTEEFQESCVSLENVQSPQLAKTLAVYADEQEMTGTTKEIGKDGTVTFLNLELGLYLMVQQDAASGYLRVDPFLVTVPMHEDDVYRYEVDASPKVELREGEEPTTAGETPGETETPEETETPQETGTSDAPGKTPAAKVPTLPNTGQLNWPIPILAVSGLMFFSIGWVLRFGRRRDTYEK